MTGATGANVAAMVRERLRPVKVDTGRRGRFVVAVLVLASFGPYVAGGLRTEQFAVYGLLATIGFVQIASLQVPPLPVRAWVLFGIWATYVTLAFASGLGAQTTRWPSGDLLAGADNVVGPLAVMLLVWSTVTATTASRALEFAAKLIAVCMALNGLLAVVMTRVDLTPLLRPFWSGAEGTATAENAAVLGRFGGVFNQPAEVGLAYGVAALCAWYVWRDRPRMLYPILLAIVLGGLLSVSKVFILGGLPVILWLLLRGARTRGTTVFVAFAAFLGLVQSGVAEQWTGLDRLGRLLRPDEDQNLLNLFTASRFGDDSTLTEVVDEVSTASPWFGVGIRGLETPYDNAWVEAFIVAGLFGVVAYTFAVLAMWVIARRDQDEVRRTFATGLVLVVLAGSLGLPALTVNRVATAVWLLVALVSLGQTTTAGRRSESGPPSR